MKKGIYGSKMSCWQRRKAKLPQDHAGVGVLGEAKVIVDDLDEDTPEVVEVERASDEDIVKMIEVESAMIKANEELEGE